MAVLNLAYVAIQPSKQPPLTVSYIEDVTPILDDRRSIPSIKMMEGIRQYRVHKTHMGQGRQQQYYRGRHRQEHKLDNQEEKEGHKQVTKASNNTQNSCRRCDKQFFFGRTCSCQYCKP